LTTSLSTPLSTKWTSNDLGGRAQFTTPEVDSQHVYVGGLQKTFYALSRNEGESISWTLDRGSKAGLSDSSGYRYSDQIFSGSGQGKLFGVDADDATRH
jgi:outer membrane protein assembly factor BamB